MYEERGTRLRRRRAFGASVVAAVTVALLAGCGSDDRSNSAGKTVAEGDGWGPTTAEWIACSGTIAFGDVVSVQESAKAGNVVLTFDVAEWLKPAQGRGRISLEVVDPGLHDEQRQLKPGQRLLIAVPQRSDQELGVLEGDAARLERERIKTALDEARSTSCPSPWSSG